MLIAAITGVTANGTRMIWTTAKPNEEPVAVVASGTQLWSVNKANDLISVNLDGTDVTRVSSILE